MTSDDQQRRDVHELLDRDHSRASISDGGRMMVDPGQVLDNIALAMERLDVDIDTPVSIEEDVVSFDELAGLIQSMRLGPTFAVHVVNTALKILAARYPAELVNSPLPPEYDLRVMQPALQVDDEQHETAKAIFNRRTASAGDLVETDVAELEPLSANDQLQVFVILFYMYGTKLGALKHRTGIQ